MTATFWTDRRVALTGATGFVGHHLAQHLADAGAHVTALLRPTSDRRRLDHMGIRCVTAPLDDEAALTTGCRGCDIVFHTAGVVDFGNDLAQLQRVNVGGTANVLAAARAAGVRRVVFTSSIVAVGASRRPRVLDETSPFTLGPFQVPYVTTKRAAEELALAASGRDLEVVVANPACVLGPEDYGGSEFGTLCRRFWHGRIPVHFGGGNNYVDVRDVARGHLLVAERGRSGERYILGGHNRAAAAFFADLARAGGRPVLRLRLPDALGPAFATLSGLRSRPGKRPYLTPSQARLAPLFFYYDTAKAERELGYRTRPLRQTLAEAYAFWMRPGLTGEPPALAAG
jgi:dihydroflavonol-4-reductase